MGRRYKLERSESVERVQGQVSLWKTKSQTRSVSDSEQGDRKKTRERVVSRSPNRGVLLEGRNDQQDEKLLRGQ